MPYPGRPYPDPLPQFVGAAVIKPTAEQRAALLEHVVRRYQEGASLRVIAAETSRTQTAIRRALDDAGVRRRGPGAPPLRKGRRG
ncbi:helix-turn-helix domain-containing protein [Ornithinimicrobium faecis]|uniref:helix-turn-helix domain-containing protein n=1 Tax=Ornithinimicrobium faecis TaxID=2934158 RepID=UPI003CE4B95D